MSFLCQYSLESISFLARQLLMIPLFLSAGLCSLPQSSLSLYFLSFTNSEVISQLNKICTVFVLYPPHIRLTVVIGPALFMPHGNPLNGRVSRPVCRNTQTVSWQIVLELSLTDLPVPRGNAYLRQTGRGSAPLLPVR